MKTRTSASAFVLIAVMASTAMAIDLPHAFVGTPYRTNVLAQLSGVGAGAPAWSSYQVTFTGGTLPPGLTLQSNGLLSGVPAAASTYEFSCALTVESGSGSTRSTETVAVEAVIRVEAADGPEMTLSPTELEFNATGDVPDPQTKLFVLSNRGAESRPFEIEVAGNSGNWVSVSSSRTAPAHGAVSIAVTVAPVALPAGVYCARLRIVFDGDDTQLEALVRLAKNSERQAIVVPRTGIAFQAVAGSAVTAREEFIIQAGGNPDLNWNAMVADKMDGSKWLTVSPGNGLAAGRAGSTVEARADASSLEPGDYYQGIMITAEGVTNSPQGVTVMMRVLPEDEDVVPAASPTGLVFTARAGEYDPAPREVTLTNIARRSYSFTGVAFAKGDVRWLSAQNSSGIIAPGQTHPVEVRVSSAGLGPGIYEGQIDIRFPDLNSTRTVTVALVVTPGGGPSTSRARSASKAGCTPTKLIPVSTQLGSGFRTMAGWPAIVDVQAVDDCGAPMTAGAVSATFTTNEPPLSLQPVGKGRWVGTWAPRSLAAQEVVITIRAFQSEMNIEGVAEIGGTVQPSRATPTITAIGTGTADDLAESNTFAPGSIITITGSGLNDGSSASTEAPCPSVLAGSRVLLKSMEVPLCMATPSEIRFMVPENIPANTTQQLIVRNGNSVSIPASITILPKDAESR